MSTLQIDFTDAQGTVETILADTAAEAHELIHDRLAQLTSEEFAAGFTVTVSDATAFLASLDEQEVGQ